MQNLLDLSESYAVSGIFALGLFVVLVTGGIDISFAAVASVVQYLIATLAAHYGLGSPAGSILLALAIGAALGMVNALLITACASSRSSSPSVCRRCCSAC